MLLINLLSAVSKDGSTVVVGSTPVVVVGTDSTVQSDSTMFHSNTDTTMFHSKTDPKSSGSSGSSDSSGSTDDAIKNMKDFGGEMKSIFILI